MKKKLLLYMTFIAIFCPVMMHAQTVDTLAFQDFEVVPAPPVWNFTGPVIYNSGFSSGTANPANSPLGIGGSRAWETTTNSGGLVLEFDNVTIPPIYDSIRIYFNLAAMNLLGGGGGPDNLDYVLVAYSLDGGANYVNRLRIRGATTDNSVWEYSATGVAAVNYLPASESLFQPVSSGLQTTMGYSHCEIYFDASLISQLRLRITGRSSSSTDTWLIDNVIMTGIRSCNESSSTITPTACGSYTSPGGNVYTSSGTYLDTIPNFEGCDSVITIQLTVNPEYISSITPVSCGPYTSPGGNVYTVSGSYLDVLSTVSGCDSTINISLTVNSPSASVITPVACGSYISPSGNVYTASGAYTDTVPNSSGCDSIITINLTVNSVNNAVSQVSNVLTAAAAGAVYQWIDCNTQQPLAGETAQVFTATANGTYAVIVTQNGCSDTSSCFTVSGLSTDQFSVKGFSAYPNPTAGNMIIQGGKPGEMVNVEICNSVGQVIFEKNYADASLVSLNIEQPSGIYFIRITGSSGEKNILKITKQ